MIVNIKLPNNISYDITIDELKELTFDRKVVIVTNPTVSGYHLEYLKNKIKCNNLSIVTIPDGEEYKNMETIDMILNHCFENRLNRKSLLIAFGGGVIGDMTGFCAAIYQRGIDFIQVPTTLLSQVDSSIGSKVGIDLAKGKNLVGSFYPPKLVIIDPVFLDTLSKREYNQGVAEMIKAGLIANKDLYNFFKDVKKVTTKEILMAIEVKRNVVLKDPFDYNERMLLNFGHTFGHAIEKKYNYQTYKHGEAISYGMLIALEIGIRKGLTPKHLYESIRHTLALHGLIKQPYFKVEDLKEDIKTDKKYTAEAFHFICLSDIGLGIVTQIKVGEF